ncbi:MAG: 30S ribosomal protein S15 [Elusimicrobia bacterium]|nr:30S ribosomal protein S15 [Elusimicrobiota bacterium]
MITKAKKAEIIQKNHGNTGKPATQISILTARIGEISGHLKSHKKDYTSQVGLLKLVGQRRRLLNYLRRTDYEDYAKVLKQLDLRK